MNLSPHVKARCWSRYRFLGVAVSAFAAAPANYYAEAQIPARKVG